MFFVATTNLILAVNLKRIETSIKASLEKGK